MRSTARDLWESAAVIPLGSYIIAGRGTLARCPCCARPTLGMDPDWQLEWCMACPYAWPLVATDGGEVRDA